MSNNTLDKAIAAVPKFGDRISLFTQKLRLAQYADSSIYNYRLKIAQAVSPGTSVIKCSRLRKKTRRGQHHYALMCRI